MLKGIYILLILILCCINGYAQKVNRDSLKELQPIRIIYKTNPAAIFWGPIFTTGEYRINREVVIDKQHSWEFGFSYLDKNPILGLIEKAINSASTTPVLYIKGFRAQISTRFYPKLGLSNRSGIAPHGFYIAPQLSYSTAYLSTTNLFKGGYYYRASNFNINLLNGIQFLIGKKFTIDLFSGIGFKQVNVKYTTPKYSKYIDPEEFFLFPGKLKLTVGVNFGIPIYRK